MTTAPIDDIELHAYVDGQLDPERRARVEERLRGDPDAAARVDAYRRQNELLRALFDPALAEPAPAAGRRARQPGGWLRHVATAAALLAAVALGWFARGVGTIPPAEAPSLAARAAVAHVTYVPEVLHPVEVGAQQEDHLVGWLSKRLGSPVRAPRLGDAGFRLVGGRLLPGEDRPAAQFMYEDAQGRRLTLYLANNPEEGRETAFRYAREGNVSVFYWVDGAFGYALSAEIPREPLLRVAEVVYRELNR